MKVLCNLSTKKIEGFSRWDDIEFNPATHTVIDIDYEPDKENERLNDTDDGLRPITQAEIDTDINTALDKQADFNNIDPILKAYILGVNDGSITPGMTNTQLKAAIRAKL